MSVYKFIFTEEGLAKAREVQAKAGWAIKIEAYRLHSTSGAYSKDRLQSTVTAHFNTGGVTCTSGLEPTDIICKIDVPVGTVAASSLVREITLWSKDPRDNSLFLIAVGQPSGAVDSVTSSNPYRMSVTLRLNSLDDASLFTFTSSALSEIKGHNDDVAAHRGLLPFSIGIIKRDSVTGLVTLTNSKNIKSAFLDTVAKSLRVRFITPADSTLYPVFVDGTHGAITRTQNGFDVEGVLANDVSFKTYAFLDSSLNSSSFSPSLTVTVAKPVIEDTETSTATIVTAPNSATGAAIESVTSRVVSGPGSVVSDATTLTYTPERNYFDEGSEYSAVIEVIAKDVKGYSRSSLIQIKVTNNLIKPQIVVSGMPTKFDTGSVSTLVPTFVADVNNPITDVDWTIVSGEDYFSVVEQADFKKATLTIKSTAFLAQGAIRITAEYAKGPSLSVVYYFGIQKPVQGSSNGQLNWDAVELETDVDAETLFSVSPNKINAATNVMVSFVAEVTMDFSGYTQNAAGLGEIFRSIEMSMVSVIPATGPSNPAQPQSLTPAAHMNLPLPAAISALADGASAPATLKYKANVPVSFYVSTTVRPSDYELFVSFTSDDTLPKIKVSMDRIIGQYTITPK